MSIIIQFNSNHISKLEQAGGKALALIEMTRAKKTSLLQVLQHPELPLHNNASELAVRQRVRKRDVSFSPRSQLGLQAWDTFMTLADTARACYELWRLVNSGNDQRNLPE